MTDANASARATLEAAHPGLVELSHRIYENPELGYEEEKAAGWLADALEAAGFETQRGYGDMPTAVVGRIGSGDLHVVICSEYDALPEREPAHRLRLPHGPFGPVRSALPADRG